MAKDEEGRLTTARFHRTHVVFVSLTTDQPSHVVIGDEVHKLPAQPVGGDSLKDLDAGLDLIRTKTGRRVVSVFIHNENARTGSRYYGVVTSPTL